VGIGLALFIAEMAGVYWTGGSLNPARSIGPCIVTWTWDKTHWIYCKQTSSDITDRAQPRTNENFNAGVGPTIGSLLAVAFYKFIKLMEYEMANPGQDADIVNDPTRNRKPHFN
jgi:glycerol uptake facilitator-like aquaporin